MLIIKNNGFKSRYTLVVKGAAPPLLTPKAPEGSGVPGAHHGGAAAVTSILTPKSQSIVAKYSGHSVAHHGGAQRLASAVAAPSVQNENAIAIQDLVRKLNEI
jgi:hypothetical protein